MLFREEKTVIVYVLNIFFELKELRVYISETYVVPMWFIYSLPDGLWAYSLIGMLIIVNGKENKILVYFLVGISTFGSEMLQYLNVINGTGDLIDVIFYVIFIGIGLIQFRRREVV